MIKGEGKRRTTRPGEIQMRFDLNIPAAFEAEPDQGLRDLYKIYLDGIAYPDGIRSSAILDNVYSATGRLKQSLSIVDTTSSSPRGFRVLRHGLQSNFESLEGLYIGDFPTSLNAATKETEYWYAVLRRRAYFQEIHQWRSGFGSRHYVKFMFPVCDQLGVVNYIISASRIADKSIVPLSSTLERPILVA